MSFTKNIFNSIKQVTLLMIVVLGFGQLVNAQCINGSAFGSASAPTGGGSVTVTTCMFGGEYNTISGVSAATNYQSTGGLGEYITITQGAPGGPVIASGFTPLNWTSTVAGTYYIHFNTTGPPGCGTDFSCHTSTLTHVSGGGGGYDPCASITNITGCGISHTVNISGTGAPWNITACGFTTSGTEVIYSYTPTASGIHSIDVTSATGGFVDFFWKPASGGCNSAGWNCIQDIFTTGNYGAMNWVAGTTYYILLDPEGTGAYSFTFDLNCPNPGGPVTAGDCPTATPVCTNLNFSINPNGFGLVDELCTLCVANPSTNPASANMGCLLSGELNSSWFLVNVFSSGTLEFSFGSPVLFGNCYDWIMWPYNASTCNDIVNNTLPPIRCNWNSPCEEFTGISTVPPAGGSAGNFEPTLNVLAGEQYIICFSNFSSAVTNVPLNFFGTASIICAALPVEILNFDGEVKDGFNQLTWATGSEINNKKFQIERSMDGENFEMIGEVDGAGNSLEVTEYYFEDHKINESGTYYYRLKQIDFNEAYTYSDIVALDANKLEEFNVLASYPNPTKNQFNIDLFVPQDETLKVVITDIYGKVIRTFTKGYVKGNNSIKIAVDDFAEGMYFVSVSNERTQKLEVIKLSKY